MARTGPRILAGRHRGRVLRAVAGVRPTEGRVREAMFNLWSEPVRGSRFLDLFAGSGAMGLEALSRGAARVAWVDKLPAALTAIRRTLRDLPDLAAESATPVAELRVLRLDLPAQARRIAEVGREWDLIYIDPPYAMEQHQALVAAVARLLATEGVMALEHSARKQLGEPGDAYGSLRVADRRQWGDCAVTLLRHPAGSMAGGATP